MLSDPQYTPYISSNPPPKEENLNYTQLRFTHYLEKKDTLVLLSDRRAKIKTESRLKEECVAAAAPHPLVLVKICKAFLLSQLS